MAKTMNRASKPPHMQSSSGSYEKLGFECGEFNSFVIVVHSVHVPSAGVCCAAGG